ncbi:hypothetical protein RF55_15123 [Lasius niger]|uniref:Uncharacterized protein n=1 Tax=Lasius niger TaxID=67767 RepID=A0A0J7K6N0_LASNI|nr:hypothetical protein RF55_15123 [Lasius niger]
MKQTSVSWLSDTFTRLHMEKAHVMGLGTARYTKIPFLRTLSGINSDSEKVFVMFTICHFLEDEEHKEKSKEELT